MANLSDCNCDDVNHCDRLCKPKYKFMTGELVEHPKHGIGEVVNVKQATKHQSDIVEVRFEHCTKTFLQSFSKLTYPMSKRDKAFQNLHKAGSDLMKEIIVFFRIAKIAEWLSRKLK